MRSTTLPLPLIVGLAAAVLLLGVIIGTGVSGIGEVEPSATPSARSSGSPAGLPAADVAGEDLARLPRYPGAVRTEHGIDEDAAWRTTTVEFLADASLDDVRAFYQGVVVDHGWQRADIAFSGGEWTYVLVDGRTEAVIELEGVGGLVEIDLQVGEPIASATPAPTPAATPQPPASPPEDDDDDDDDDDG